MDSENQRVIVIDRRSFDKELAFQAQSTGVEIHTKSSIISVNFAENLFKVKISRGKILKAIFLWRLEVLIMLLKRDSENPTFGPV